MSNIEVEAMMKPSEIAEKFGVTTRTVGIWLREGQLKGIKIGKGKYWRVPLSEVKRFAEARHGSES